MRADVTAGHRVLLLFLIPLVSWIDAEQCPQELTAWYCVVLFTISQKRITVCVHCPEAEWQHDNSIVRQEKAFFAVFLHSAVYCNGSMPKWDVKLRSLNADLPCVLSLADWLA
jgi:hypothetical protein